MKASEIYSRSLALLGEQKGHDRAFLKNVIPLINQLLAVCLDTENAIRESKGDEILQTAQKIENLEDEIIYDEHFVSSAMPYGLAAMLCADDDREMSNSAGREFERLKSACSAVNFSSVNDYYA